MSKIRIGLDFHGVIDTNPSYFKEFCSAAISIGWKIFIITGGPYEKVKTLLEKWQIPYSEIFAIYDYYDKLGKVKKEGEKFFVDEKRYLSKAAIGSYLGEMSVLQLFFLKYCCLF